MRVADDFFDQAIAALGIRGGEPVKQRPLLRVFGEVIQIPLFLMAKRLAIGDEKLQITGVGQVHVGIINLVDDAVAQGEPQPGTGIIGGADAVLGAGGPMRFDAGSARGVRI